MTPTIPPLHLACAQGQVELVEALIATGVDLNAVAIRNLTPLHYAAGGGQVEVADVLLQHGARIDAMSIQGSSPLRSAVDARHPQVVRLLLKYGADIETTDMYGWSPLNNSADEGDDEMVKLLLENHASTTTTNCAGYTPLHSAAASGRLETVRILLEHEADARSSTDHALRSVDAVISVSGRTPLHLAVISSNKAVVQCLLQFGANVNSQTKLGETALHFAISRCPYPIMDLLISHGADMTLRDCYGGSCLEWMLLMQPESDHVKNANGSSPTIQTEITKRTIHDLAVSLQEQVDTANINFYRLGHCFILIDQIDDARKAFWQHRQVKEAGTKVSYRYNCDMCGSSPIAEPFVACRSCRERDLCLGCLDTFRQEQSKACRQHEYVEIGPPDDDQRDFDVNAWLSEVATRYEPSSGDC